ncbi:MAG: hypothetical protein D8M57_07940 [Candidatus Scalindua sp. AMX11]|nr:MAG: hypothetical protein DWQ00_11540 [Candidatus Scalindua sp.]TDE65446.1 MAG: hypothetical protein D8M57_07940 [Candidatus Scalindua sp. AMX11]
MQAILRVLDKITLQSIALRFRSDLVDLIELNRKRSLSYVRIRRMKIGQKWPENEMQEYKVIFSRILNNLLSKTLVRSLGNEW